MQRLQFVLVALLVGALLFASYSNRNLREQVNRTTRALRVANRTDTQLQECRKSLGEHRLTSIRVDSEKKTLNWRIRHMTLDIKALKEKADMLPDKDAEIQRLNAELKKVSDKETTVKKLLKEAQKALDILKKENKKKDKDAAATKTNNASSTPPPDPPKKQ